MTKRNLAVIAARPVGAVAGGVLLACSFPSVGWWWAAPVAVAILTLVARTSPTYRASFGWGLLSGVVTYLILVQWMSVLGIDAWLALVAYSALWIALTFVAVRVVRALAWWPLAVAALWVLQEALRDRIPFGGFPWGRLAFSQADAPTLHLAAIGGAVLITFAVSLCGSLIAYLVVSWSSMAIGKRIVAALGALAIVLVGLAIPVATAGQAGGGPASATVAIIQGSVPQTGLNAMAERRVVLNNHVNETIRLADDVKAGRTRAPDAVIWPENSTDIDPLADQSAAAAITRAADAIGVPILVGAVTTNPTMPGTLWNVGIVWQPRTGPSQYYVKRHPVPFGEYVPFRSFLQRYISRFDRVPYDFVGGDNPGVLDVGPVRLGDVICFEIAYDRIVSDVVAHGARAISVQTNNATYLFRGAGGQAQPDQQAAMSQIRAVEHGRTVMIAATSGVTAVIDPAGIVVASLPFNEPGYLVEQIALRDSNTVATYATGWLEFGFVVLATGALLVAILRVRRRHETRLLGTGNISDNANC